MLRERFRHILVLSFLFFLPFSGILWMFDQRQMDDATQKKDADRENLQAVLAHYSRLSQPEVVLKQTMDRIKRALMWEADPQPLMESLSSQAVSLYLFSAAGKRKKAPGFSNDFVFASEHCLSLILSVSQGKSLSMTLKDRNLAETFLGTSRAIQLLAEKPNQLHNLESLGIARRTGIFSFRNRTGLRGIFIVVINNLKLFPLDFLTRAREKIRKLAGTFCSLGFIDLLNDVSEPAVGIASLASLHPPPSLVHGQEELVEAGGRLWGRDILDRRWLLFSSIASGDPLQPFVVRQGRFLLYGLSLFLVFLAGSMLLEKRGIPIRFQISLLFLLASFACVSLLLGFADRYSEIRRKSALRERQTISRQILEKMDHAFSSFQNRVSKKFNGLTDGLARHGSGPAAWRNVLRELAPFQKSLSARVFDSQGNTLFQMNSGTDSVWQGMWGNDFRKTMSQIVRLAIKVYNLETQFGNWDVDPSINAETVMVKRTALIFYEFQRRVKLHRSGASAFPIYFDFLRGPDGLAKGAFWVTFEENFIERQYCAFLRKFTTFHLWSSFPFRIIPLLHGRKIPWHRHRGLPWATVTELNSLLMQVKNPGYLMGSLLRRPVLVTAVPGKELPDYDLFLIGSLTDLEKNTRAFSRNFLLIVLCILVFAMSLSSLFSRILIAPINQLSQGLAYLTRSNFRHQISIQTGDELEKIGSGINQILEEMNELALAKNIQEHLFPPGALQSSRWVCQGWNKSSSDIGGEIYDFLDLGQNRLVLWMACVPGHSIGSALILAMIKMAIRLILTQEPSPPRLIIEAVQERLLSRLEGLQEGQLMIAIFDGASGALDAAFTGDFSLLKLTQRPGDVVARLVPENPETRPDRAVQTIRCCLEPKDRILMFSPGCRDIRPGAGDLDEALKAQVSLLQPFPLEKIGSELIENLGRSQQETSATSQTVLGFEVKAI